MIIQIRQLNIQSELEKWKLPKLGFQLQTRSATGRCSRWPTRSTTTIRAPTRNCCSTRSLLRLPEYPVAWTKLSALTRRFSLAELFVAAGDRLLGHHPLAEVARKKKGRESDGEVSGWGHEET